VSDLRELYQEVILDHNRRPRNFRAIEGANRHAEGYNPLCGDRLSLYLKVEDGVIKDASFQGSGCAISKASASMMTDSVKGKTLSEARMFEQFHQMADALAHQNGGQARGSKASNYPARGNARASPGTLRSAVDAKDEVVSTETNWRPTAMPDHIIKLTDEHAARPKRQRESAFEGGRDRRRHLRAS
jgi:nitrogen fixation NifU-like protein